MAVPLLDAGTKTLVSGILREIIFVPSEAVNMQLKLRMIRV